MKTKQIIPIVILLSCSFAPLDSVFAQGTAFTYQGQLNSSSNAANGSYDFTFTLFAQSSGGSAVSGPVTNSAVLVTNGLFTTTLDLSNNFPGANRWLELGVRSNLTGTFITLTPRQKITAVPYAITASNVTGVVASGSLSGTYSTAVSLNNAANTFTGNGAGLTSLDAGTLASGQVPSSVLNNAWKTIGNAGTTTTNGANFLGTTDNQAFEIKVNALRGLRLEPATDPTNLSVNVVGGSPANFSAANNYGATIGGGGGRNFGGVIFTNSVISPFGTVSGGAGNSVAAFGGTIAGGFQNSLTGGYSAVGGGLSNSAAGIYSTVPGGYANTASGAQSFAAGNKAQAIHDGAFVWGDNSTTLNFTSTGVNQFLIRAAGGVGIGTASPQTQLHVRSANGKQLMLESSTVGATWSIYTEDNRPTSSGNLLFVSSSGSFIYFDTSGIVHGASDQRLKRDITPAGPALDRLLQLRPVSYRMRGQPDDAARTLGFLAQEVEPLFPEVVGETHGMKSLAYSEMVPITVGAIQELNGKVLSKDAEIQELKQQNQALTKRLDQLESIVHSLAEKQ